MLFPHAKLCLRTVGIAVAVLAAAACSPSRAAAECGDYVHIATDTPDTTKPQPLLPRQPCDGPSCSQRKLPPIAPLTAPSTGVPVLKSFAEMLPLGDTSEARHGCFAIQESLTLPDPFPSSIFHPPRS